MEFIHEYPIIIPFIAILSAEVAKVCVYMFKKNKVRFLNTGGMPSGHSAFVSALAVTVAYREGVGSTMFMVASVVAVIVMYDAINLRHEAGKHAKALNDLDENFSFDERLGHNHWEVIIGAIFGAFVAFFLLII